ncbi:hypothetical protein ACLB2K_016951 [Fragaria x ananassa]
MDGLAFGMVKSSGPSKGGGGHRARTARILQVQHGIKDNSGPSPGVRREASDMDQSVQPLKRVGAKDSMNLGDRICLPISVKEFPDHKPEEGHCSEEEAEFIRSLVLYKDPAIIVINKPPGLPVQGGIGIKRSFDELAATCLSYDLSQPPRLVHRLDRDCSGILVMGRTQTSATVLHSIFREKTFGASDDVIKHAKGILQRRYLTLVIGSPRQQEGLISVPLGKVVVDNGKSDRITILNKAQCLPSQHAITKYKVIGSSCPGFTWLELIPLTGRKHQCAKDDVGHGTHTASTAGGNTVKNVSFCGLAQEDILGALEDATADGVDTITVSLTGILALHLNKDPVAIGAFHATEKGLVTTNAACHDGPGAGPITSVAPWLLTVAASSTDGRLIDKVVLGNGSTFVSINSFTLNGTSSPLIYGGESAASSQCSEFEAMSSSCLNSNLVKGKVVLCDANLGAGEAAYAKAFHPKWSPAAIKSSLMSTSWPMNVTDDAPGEFAYVTGHINPVQVIDPGLVYEACKEDYKKLLCSVLGEAEVRLISGDNSTCSTLG